MKLCLTGLNHRTAPVEVRERLAFDAIALPQALEQLRQRPGMEETMILSTCNRVEITVTARDGADPGGCVEEFLSDFRQVKRDFVSPHLYRFDGPDAIRHLFRVAASLDSMVVGEPQILGQLKQAYAAAKAQGTLSGFLDTVVTRAFNVAKRVRSETEIGANAVSVSFAAVELAREIFGSLKDKKVMLIGAGKMSEAAARHLHRNGVSQIFVTNRTRERAQEMAELFQGRVIDYDKYYAILHEVDIVITSSGAPHYILTRENMRKVIEARRNKPMFVIDIAVPRNVDPAVNSIDNVFLYDIDDLGRVVERNVQERKHIAIEAEEIIREEVERTLSRLKSRELAPTIVSLQEHLEALRAAELQRVRGKLGTLTKQQEEAIEALTRGLINKIAHGPIAEMRKHAGAADGEQWIGFVRSIFRLGE